MALSEARKRANEKWNAKAYDEIKVRVEKGKKDAIKAHAKQHDNGSVNGFINRAISETMKREVKKFECQITKNTII